LERKMIKIPKQEYTGEFKELAVKRIKEGLTPGAVSKELGGQRPDSAELG
jgi:transposase